MEDEYDDTSMGLGKDGSGNEVGTYVQFIYWLGKYSENLCVLFGERGECIHPTHFCFY